MEAALPIGGRGEHAIEHDYMEVEVRVEGGAKPMEDVAPAPTLSCPKLVA